MTTPSGTQIHPQQTSTKALLQALQDLLYLDVYFSTNVGDE